MSPCRSRGTRDPTGGGAQRARRPLSQDVEGAGPCDTPQRPAWSYRKDRRGLTAKTDLVLPQRPAWSYRKDWQGLRRKICQMPETRNLLGVKG